ncbi:hypothetical protein Ddye_001020 [Dipteronia dyeriana]|uniref:Uncharacterized protein n=1 Tax=Dipteronia dyeriana TaxID=168575 RepID=A0AAD9XMP0_9ROSI|nr:hypothetical protein Ddye_001020 [Dipteronia dyeriana]
MPIGVANKIERLQRRFLWGDRIEKRKLHTVDWLTVCKNKRKGGQGFRRMVDKNKSLAKWIWRYGCEKSALWRKVVCAKYDTDRNSLFWNLIGKSSSSFSVKAVADLLMSNSMSSRAIEEGFKVVIGNGNKARFWNDIKIGLAILNEAFHRVFLLAIKKEGVVKEFGHWIGSMWTWEVKLRRQPFDWEKKQWQFFLKCLDYVVLREPIEDVLAWGFCPNGRFFIGSFCKVLEGYQSADMVQWRSPWRGLCPPKAGFFMW